MTRRRLILTVSVITFGVAAQAQHLRFNEQPQMTSGQIQMDACYYSLTNNVVVDTGFKILAGCVAFAFGFAALLFIGAVLLEAWRGLTAPWRELPRLRETIDALGKDNASLNAKVAALNTELAAQRDAQAPIALAPPKDSASVVPN